MLVELRVENLGIIDEVLVSFAPGMTAITGETGAGKTLLVDALALLCGERADASVVRGDAGEARVEGRFLAGDDEVVLARVVPAVGRSRGYVNGRLATAAEMGECSRRLVDLHGQHAQQSLLVPAEQRALLDRFAGDSAERARTRLLAARAEGRRCTVEIEALGGDERTRAREIDLLRYQLGEIDAAQVHDADEDDVLATEADVLADADAHREALATAHEHVEGAARDALGAAAAALAGREPFAALHARVLGLQAEAAEAAHDLRLAREGIVVDPERLAVVQARRGQLRELIRKYGPTLADVVAYESETRARLADLEGHDERIATLRAARDEAEAAAVRHARDLTRARQAAATGLAAAVTEQLRTLAMPKASFSIAVEPGPLTDDGADDVGFLLAPNPGEPPRPLAKAASGGELSRTMLALRVVLSEAPPTLVFDEVDAGIGGEAGSAVGRALACLGGRHQVLCVTHLAQVAAFADAQIAVTKREAAGRTVARPSVLLDDARVGELARMLSGDLGSDHARSHAEELLAASAARRREVRRP